MEFNLKNITQFKIIAPIIFLITIFITSNNLINSQFFHVHDFTSGARIYELHQTLKDGQFPPRWSKDFGYGFGMPLFEFYSPLFFYISEFFLILNFSIVTSLKLALILVTIIGFLGSFNLTKKLTNKWGGLIGAVAFTLAPYHAVNLYVRGAFAEYLGISLIPFTLYFSLKLIEKFSKENYFYTTIFLAAILLSHNVTVLTFFPFYILFTLYYLIAKKKIKSILTIFLSGINAFLLSSSFLLPAFIQKKYTLAESLLTSGFSNYQFHFLYFRQLFIPNWGYGGSILGINDDMSLYIGNELVIISIVAGILLLIKFKKNKKENQTKLSNFIFISILLLLSIFLTNFKSRIIWDNLPLISYIQFPWRFLGLTSFFLAILTSYIGILIVNKKIIIPIIILILFLNFNFFKPEELTPINDFYNPNPKFIQNTMTGILPDYLPNNIKWENYSSKDISLEFVKNENTKINISEEKTQSIKADLETLENNVLSIFRFRFPNWKIKLDGKIIDCDTTDFYYKCQIPEGKHEISFYWSEDGLNRISNYMSLFGLVLLFYIYKKNGTK